MSPTPKQEKESVKDLSTEQSVQAESKQDKQTWLTSVKAVLWSFVGVRRKGGWEEDAEHLKPYPVLLVGLGLGIAFVLALMLFVHWVAG